MMTMGVPAGKIKILYVSGYQDAIKAKNLKRGDVVMWNGGSTSVVRGVEFSKSGKTCVVHFDDHDRKTTPNREFAIVGGVK